MKPEERDALLLDLQCAGAHSDHGWLQRLCERAAAALTAQSPAGVPPEPTMLADAANNLYDAGHWHCDRPVDEAGLWTALRDALGRPAGTSPQPIRATGVPTTEPVAPIAREPDMRRECSCVEVCYQKQGAVLGKNWKCRVEAERALYAARAVAPQAPAEPVAQEPAALLPCPWCGNAGELNGHPVDAHHAEANWWCECSAAGDPECPVWPSGRGYRVRDEAIAAWNRRASPISLPVEGSRLQDENARLHARINECEQRRKIEYDLGYKAGHADATRG